MESPHDLHDTKFEYPRLLIKRMICSFFASLSRISPSSCPLNMLRLPFFSSCLMSMTWISGNAAPGTALSGSERSLYLPSRAARYDSGDGVALASITLAPCTRALSCTTSRTSYRGVFSFLYAPSCSSSTTISPMFFIGANAADLGPMMISASPSAHRRNWSYRSPSESFECTSATLLPNTE